MKNEKHKKKNKEKLISLFIKNMPSIEHYLIKPQISTLLMRNMENRNSSEYQRDKQLN